MFGLGKTPGKAAFFLVFLLTISLLLSGGALAAGGQEGADRSGDLIDLGKRFLNFALLLIILFWAVKKSGIKGFFSARSREIGQRLEDLKREKEEAEGKYKDVEKRLREFEDKKQEIIEEFKSEGLAEKEKIIKEAGERVKKIIDQAELTIRQEMESARDRLKQEVVNLAAEKAQELISKKMTDKDQDYLVDEFIERVGKIH